VLRELQRGLPAAEAGWLALKDAADGLFRPVAALGGDPALLGKLSLRPDEALLGCDDALTPCLYASRDAADTALSNLAPETRTGLAQAWAPIPSLTSLVVVPLSVGSRLIGVLWLASAGRRSHFSPDDRPRRCSSMKSNGRRKSSASF
jgi:GAF domain-containing protein